MQAKLLVGFWGIALLMVSMSCRAHDEPLAAGVTIARTQVFELTQAGTQRVYPLWVKLPRSYHRHNKRHYPVIYVTDAPYAFQIVSGATRFPMNSGKMREAIIVGLSYAQEDRGPQSRVRDYTPFVDPSWKRQTGGADVYADFLEQQVFAFVEQRYRTAPHQRTFVGNSLGGLLGAYLLLKRLNMFDSYVLGSPSVWFFDEQILTLTSQAAPEQASQEQSASQQQRPNLRVFIAVGEREVPGMADTRHDMVAGADKLRRHLEANMGKALTVESLLINGASHETAFPTTASQGLYWLYRKES